VTPPSPPPPGSESASAVPARRHASFGARIATRLLSRGTLSSGELGLAGLGLALFAVVVYARYVSESGFAEDEWIFEGLYKYPQSFAQVVGYQSAPGLHGAFNAYIHVFSYRPLGGLFLLAKFALFGMHMAWHLTLAVAFGVGVAVCLYALLRLLGLEPLHASVPAVLLLVFPGTNVLLLWGAGVHVNFAVLLYLLGLLIALRALRLRGFRAAAFHGLSLALYLASILTYQVVLTAMLGSIVVYRIRATWRRSLARAAADVSIFLIGGAILGASTPKAVRESSLSVGGSLSHAREIAKEGLMLLGRAAVPFQHAALLTPALVALAVIGVAFVVWRALPEDDATRAELRRWVLVAVAAMLWVAASYAVFVPANAGYVPLAPGWGERVNGVAALGYVTLVYSAVMLGATLLFHGVPQPRRWTIASSLAAVLVVASGYVNDTRQAERVWTDAFDARTSLLASVTRALARAPAGATAYVWGTKPEFAPGVPLFLTGNTLNAAAKLVLRDPSRSAYLMYPQYGIPRTFVCAKNAMYPSTRGGTRLVPWLRYGRRQSSAYGRALFFQYPSARVTPIDDRATCRAMVDRLSRTATPRA
jgi:hypothetical protein